MKKLISGIKEFQNNEYLENKGLFQELANRQEPEVMFFTCSDSRVDPALITQTEPGDLFIHRNAGNIVPPHSRSGGGVTASIEFAVSVLGVKYIILCGHTDCGAMKGAMKPETSESLPHVHAWLSNCTAALARVQGRHKDINCDDHLVEMTEENILLQLKHLETHPCVATGLAQGTLELHGWIYNIGTGEVNCHDPATGKFISVADRYAYLHPEQEKQEQVAT